MTAFPRMISAQMLPAPSISQVKSQNSEPILSDSQPSASQLSDVQPTDWAYQALQSLMERYRCIAGYPSQSFRGGRSLTRHEFAVGLKACLDQMETDKALHDDLKTVQRLQQVFAAELSVLRGRVDGLEAKTSTLETEQFSTTTKLSGDAIFQIADIYGKEVDRDNNTVFHSRVRLTLDTSFTGKDRLRIRLQSGNFQTFTQPGNEARFGYATNTNNALQLGVLNYQFPVGDRTTVVLFANGDSFEELTFFNPINPFDVVGGRGAISRFAALPPIYRTANTSAGAGINVNLTKNLSFAAGYLAGESASSMPGSGLFGGDYGVIGRLLAKDLFKRLDLSFTYIHSYTGVTQTATDTLAGIQTFTGSKLAAVDVDRPVAADSYGIGANWRISPKVQLGGWVGYSAIQALEVGNADVWNYGVGLAFPDLGKVGNLGGIIVGMEPRLTDTTPALGAALGARRDPDVGLHVEAFYRITLNDYIDITPGFVWLTVPNHDESNADIVMATVRATFRF